MGRREDARRLNFFSGPPCFVACAAVQKAYFNVFPDVGTCGVHPHHLTAPAAEMKEAEAVKLVTLRLTDLHSLEHLKKHFKQFFF